MQHRQHSTPIFRFAPPAWLALAVSVLLVAAALRPAAGRADAFGQLASYGSPGSPGTGPGQLYAPGEIGVDPGADLASDADDSIYVLDTVADRSSFRLQKLVHSGATLTPVASATIPAPANAGGYRPVFLGIAVDPSLHRLYLLQYRRSNDPVSGLGAAEQILVFSTEQVGGALVAPSDVPSGTLPVPAPTSSEAIDWPYGFALDPSTHDLFILGYKQTTTSSERAIVVQRIGSDGKAGARYVDPIATTVFNGFLYDNAWAFAVAPDGTAYIGQGADGFKPIVLTSLSADFSTVTPLLLGGSDPHEGEWAAPSGLNQPYSGEEGGGPQMAVTADGSRIYWAENLVSNGNTTPGSYQLRGYNLVTKKTAVVYGGGTSSCLITAHGPGIATSGNDFVYVLDHGNFNTNPPTYGGDVVEFGPGGTGCPIPDPRFTVNGSTSSTVTVQKGSSVQFLADTSHLNGATATQLEWDLDGSGAFATVAKGPNPILEESYKYLKAGTYTVSMKMQLTGGTVNELPPATKTVTVVPGTPTAAFKASTSSPKPSEEVTFDASSSIDPTGSPTAGPTKELKTYSWDFGDGTKQETTTATTTHAFANTSTTPVNRTVKLTVTSIDNIQSTPVTQTIMVLGIPAPPTPAPITLPPAPLPISTPPAAIPAGPGAASLLTATIKGTSAALTIGCATSPGACEGTLTLTASVPAAKHHGKTQAHARATVIGSTSFTIAAGGRGAVSVKITKAAMALLAKSHRLTVTARIVTHNSAGTQASTSKTVALTQTAKGKTGGKHH